MNSRRQMGFLKSYLTGLLLNVSWTEPALILLILHITFGTPLRLVFLALTVWAGAVFMRIERMQAMQERPERQRRNRTVKLQFPLDISSPIPQREYAAYCDLLADRDI